jgi:hypothetical protein
MADVTITLTRDETEYLVRGHTPEGVEFVDDWFGVFIQVDANWQPIRTPWPQRDGARVVKPMHLSELLFAEIEKRALDVRLLIHGWTPPMPAPVPAEVQAAGEEATAS